MTPHKGPICLFISGSTPAARIESHVIEVASCECGEIPRRPAGHSWWGRGEAGIPPAAPTAKSSCPSNALL